MIPVCLHRYRLIGSREVHVEFNIFWKASGANVFRRGITPPLAPPHQGEGNDCSFCAALEHRLRDPRYKMNTFMHSGFTGNRFLLVSAEVVRRCQIVDTLKTGGIETRPSS